MIKIGVTERGDGGLNHSWMNKLGSVDGVIIITKHPQKLPSLVSPKMLLHCTITGMGGTVLEPGVKPWRETIEAYEKWLGILGPERCILRVDPIIPTKKGLEAALRVIEHCNGRLRISFMDMYPHVIERFKAASLPIPFHGSFHYPLEKRMEALEAIQRIHSDVEICAEPDMKCSGCVSQRDLAAIGLDVKLDGKSSQRPLCMCVAQKVELLDTRHPCGSKCLYCYWRG